MLHSIKSEQCVFATVALVEAFDQGVVYENVWKLSIFEDPKRIIERINGGREIDKFAEEESVVLKAVDENLEMGLLELPDVFTVLEHLEHFLFHLSIGGFSTCLKLERKVLIYGVWFYL